MRSVSNTVMQGNTLGLPSVPASTRPTIPQLMAQPCHYTQLGLRKALRGLPALVQIRPGDSARYFIAVRNIWDTNMRQLQRNTEHCAVEQGLLFSVNT